MGRSGCVVLGVLLLVGLLAWSLGTSGMDTPAPDAAELDEESIELPRAPTLTAHAQPAPAQEAASIPPPRPMAEPETGETSYAIEGAARVTGTNAVVGRGTIVAWAKFAERSNGRMRTQRKTWRADLDGEGHFHIDVTGSPPMQVQGFLYEGGPLAIDTWSLEGTRATPLESGNTQPRRLDATPGTTYLIALHLRSVFRLRGEVVDETGASLGGVAISFHLPVPAGGGYLLQRRTATATPEGRFDIGVFTENSPGAYTSAVERQVYRRITFKSEGFVVARLDPWSVAPGDRDRVRVVMDQGATLAGVLVDAAGRALPDVVVDVEYGIDWNLRRATRTDADGHWHLDRLQRGKALLRARAFAYGAKVRREIEIEGDDLDMQLIAAAIDPPPPEKLVKVLGLSLLEVDDKLREVYELPPHVAVLIIDAGEGHPRLGIGKLEPGYGLWMVGDAAVASLNDAVKALWTLGDPRPSKPGAAPRRPPHVRVVYTFANERMRGTNTQMLRLTEDDIDDLRLLAERLGIKR